MSDRTSLFVLQARPYSWTSRLRHRGRGESHLLQHARRFTSRGELISSSAIWHISRNNFLFLKLFRAAPSAGLVRRLPDTRFPAAPKGASNTCRFGQNSTARPSSRDVPLWKCIHRLPIVPWPGRLAQERSLPGASAFDDRITR